MAGCMKGVQDTFEWKDAIQELEESSMMQDGMKSEVFPILHCSNTRLRDPRLQKCFLYCCLYPEDFEIPRVELVNKFIMEGFINARNSRQAQIDQGHAILNKLENVCLLESIVDVDENKCVKMHDLTREMDIKITSHPHHDRFMVKAGMQLIEMPELHEWSEDIDKVSLMQNQIYQISPSVLYKCLKLTTLLLQKIPYSFFIFKPCLRVLDFDDEFKVTQFLQSFPSLNFSDSGIVGGKGLVLSHIMNQLKNQDSASSLPALPRLDRLDHLLQLLEEKHGLSGRHYTALKKQEEEKDQSKTNLTLSSAIEEVQHKGTLMERLAVLETRVLQISQISLDMNEGYTSRSSTSTGPVSFFERSVTIGQVQDDKANLQQSKGHHLAVEVIKEYASTSYHTVLEI
ncbi:hypothetical protein RND71_034369 [Anisodus tanguticus]|uniref:Disease resistance protein winged helix domain-containing protein n=1 Tax=Anisodus tanguticus TaxID=243964 RepID=A0AAE1RAF9_9SOLA|nr:hypothetical protein RND71_034369 [Anisodus tanguticus]